MARRLTWALGLLLLLGYVVVACGPSGSRGRGGWGSDDDDSSAEDDDDSAVVVDDDDSTVVGDDDDSSVVVDDDDSTVVVDDDDDTLLGPYEGDWTGTSVGYIRFGVIEYTCTGAATVHVDSQGLAIGAVTCALDGRPGYACDATLPAAGIYVDGAAGPHDVPCTGFEFDGVLQAFSVDYLIGQISEVIYDEVGDYEIEVIIDYDMVR